MQTIPVTGPTDSKLGFDTYPNSEPVLDASRVGEGVKQPPRDGFWLMVRVGSRRTVRLGTDTSQPVKIVGPDDDGIVRQYIAGEPILETKMKGDRIEITGIRGARDVQIDIFQPDRHLRGYVSVLPRREVPVCAHYVQHGPGLKCRISTREMRHIFSLTNSMLEPQCNVRLVLVRDRVLTHHDIGKHLGPIFRLHKNPKRDELQYLLPHRQDVRHAQPQGARYTKPLNLFVVRHIIMKDGMSALGITPREFGMCVLDDRSFMGINLKKAAAKTLAHELGHYLMGPIYRGRPKQKYGNAHNPFKGSLMYPFGRG